MTENDVLADWDRERKMHPFFGENISETAMKNNWDSSAERYNDDNYVEIKRKIIDTLLDRNILSEERTLIDIGCGPGTFSLPLSKHVSHITCLDYSEPMIERLINNFHNAKIDNYSAKIGNWNNNTDKFDIAFASLCPPLNCPEGLKKMESYADEFCIYISSANLGSGIQIEIWKELGKDYSYCGYNTEHPYNYLKHIEKDPALDYFTQTNIVERTVEEEVQIQTNAIGKYREITPEISKIIGSVVSKHSENDMICFESTMRLGLLVWIP